MALPKNCFLDKTRVCAEECKAYSEKDKDCRLLRSLILLSSTLSAGAKWLPHRDPQKLG